MWEEKARMTLASQPDPVGQLGYIEQRKSCRHFKKKKTIYQVNGFHKALLALYCRSPKKIVSLQRLL